MRHVAQAESDRHAVKVIVGERQFLGVALRYRQQEALVAQTVAAVCEHGVVDVGQPHLTGLADLARKSQRQVAGTTRDVEHARAFAHAAAIDGERLPQAMQPTRHQVVHQVVAIGDGIEHTGHAPGLVGLGDVFVAEVSQAIGHEEIPAEV